MAYPEATWALIRRAYEDGSDTVKLVAARHGVSVRSVQRRARVEGWLMRSERKLRAQFLPPEPVRDLGPAEAVSDKDLVARLYRAIDEKLKRLEARMGSDREISAAESERETRELGVMIRGFEKVTEFATEIENRRKPAAPERTGAADAERMRAEIAERLERLASQGNAEAGSGEPER